MDHRSPGLKGRGRYWWISVGTIDPAPGRRSIVIASPSSVISNFVSMLPSQCIRSRTICLRVKRKSGNKLGESRRRWPPYFIFHRCANTFAGRRWKLFFFISPRSSFSFGSNRIPSFCFCSVRMPGPRFPSTSRGPAPDRPYWLLNNQNAAFLKSSLPLIGYRECNDQSR